MMRMLLKACCLAVYALAIAGMAGLLPASLAGTLRTAALAFIGIHILETVVMFRHVRSYRGPLAISIVLSLLFGLLHWKPLADAAARSEPK